jgi:hypothetical protein
MEMMMEAEVEVEVEVASMASAEASLRSPPREAVLPATQPRHVGAPCVRRER